MFRSPLTLKNYIMAYNPPEGKLFATFTDNEQLTLLYKYMLSGALQDT